MKSRSAKIIVTNEARVLKAMRLEHKLSMKRAAALMGISDSTVAHTESGRMNPPTGTRLDRFLKIYGDIKAKSFYDRVRTFQASITPQEELIELVGRANSDQVKTLLNVARGLLR